MCRQPLETWCVWATPSDVVPDEGRARLYLVNSSANRIDVWDYSRGRSTLIIWALGFSRSRCHRLSRPPLRSPWTRADPLWSTPGTNLYTGAGTGAVATNLGTAVAVNLISSTAINVPNTIRVFMNFRDATQRGQIYPVPTAPNSATATAPTLAATRPIVNAVDGTTAFKPGSFVTINGSSLASPATANALPAPTVLGGSCVVMNNVAIPLLQTSGGQIAAQIPSTIRSSQVAMQVRSLATPQTSAPVVVSIQKP